MPSQLVKLAIIDTSAYRLPPFEEVDIDCEVFSVIQEGAQNASRQVVSIENNSVFIEGGRELYEQKTYTLDVVGMFDLQRRQKLFNWAKNRTRLIVCGYSLDGHYLYATGNITIVDGFEENASVHFRLSRSSVGGYDLMTAKHNADFIFSKNLLSLFAWQKPFGTYGDPASVVGSSGSYPDMFRESYRFDGIIPQKPAAGLSTVENITYNNEIIQYNSETLAIATEAPALEDDDILRIEGSQNSFDDSTRYFECTTYPTFETRTTDDNGNVIVTINPTASLYRGLPFPFPNVKINYTIQVGNISQVEDVTDLESRVYIAENSKEDLYFTRRSFSTNFDGQGHSSGDKYTVSLLTRDDTFYLRFLTQIRPGWNVSFRNPIAWIGDVEPDYTEFYS